MKLMLVPSAEADDVAAQSQGHQLTLDLERGGEVLVCDDRRAAAGAALGEIVWHVFPRIGDGLGAPALLRDGGADRGIGGRQPHLDVADVVEVHGQLGLRVGAER